MSSNDVCDSFRKTNRWRNKNWRLVNIEYLKICRSWNHFQLSVNSYLVFTFLYQLMKCSILNNNLNSVQWRHEHSTQCYFLTILSVFSAHRMIQLFSNVPFICICILTFSMKIKTRLNKKQNAVLLFLSKT